MILQVSRGTICIFARLRSSGDYNHLLAREMTSSTPDGRVSKRVVVIMAMLAEATPLLKSLGCDPESPDRFLVKPGELGRVYTGAIVDEDSNSQLEVFVVCNGKCITYGCDSVGKVPAAVVTHMAINELKPDILINAGTCGGFASQGCAIGDVFVVSQCKVHDARIPLPVLEDYGVGSWKPRSAMNLVTFLGVKSGILTTGDSLDCPDIDRDTIAKSGAHVKDMEGSAIAYIAKINGDVPVILIKSVTDIVDGGRATQEEFLENLHTAATALMDKMTKTLDFINKEDISSFG